ncbi:stage II sporulation protein M [Candidatus Pacearchaeota archaeon]|nr:stage II sporulation protein M [Candidatus Pacearchaeota archaeon]
MRKKQKKKKDFIYDHFRNGLKTIRDSKIYLYFAVGLFLLFTFIGFLFPIFFDEQIQNTITDLVNKTEGLGPYGLMRFIITNNILTSFFGMMLGILLGLPTLFVLVLNGYILGYAANKSVAIEGILILWRLLPHGIFELPAVLISLGLGIKLGYELMINCIHSIDKKANQVKISLLRLLSFVFFPIAFFVYLVMTFTRDRLRNLFIINIRNSLDVFIFIVVPLLVIAGIIEGFLIWVLS